MSGLLTHEKRPSSESESVTRRGVPNLIFPVKYCSSEQEKKEQDFILPAMAPADVKEKKKTAVLDLDETLVHLILQGGTLGRFDFKVVIEYKQVRRELYLLKRPGVDELLQGLAISSEYEIVVFSAGEKAYVNAVVDKLLLDLPPIEGIDNNMNIIPPTHRLCRDKCTGYQYPGETKIRYVKDLSLLGRDLSKVIIVDDKPRAFHLHPRNGIRIDCWTGDTHDRSLFRLLGLFKAIQNSKIDVRTVFDPLLQRLNCVYPASKKEVVD